MTLTENLRGRLERAISEARAVLDQDFAATAEGRFGFHESGHIEDESALKLTPAELEARRELNEAIDHLRAAGNRPGEAVARLLREAAFTTLNRLVAIRVAEAIGLLQPSLRDGRSSQGFREVLEVCPLLDKAPTGGYWAYLRLCADELARDAPVLFDPRNPLLALAPSARTLDELVGIFADPELAGVWAEPETFGWTYQYFNQAEERRAMRENPAPKGWRELAVRNQFFTPRYVVDFLVHNSLGRRLLEADPASPLRGSLSMLIDPPEEKGAPLKLEAVRALDPAVGSGHFLLGCYDVLERAWELRGVNAREAARRILPALWGIDIDPRCAQVAAAALVLRARRRNREDDLPRPHIYTARPMPADEEVWAKVLEGLDLGLRRLVARVREALNEAPVLGSLLKVEETIKDAIDQYYLRLTSGRGSLFTELADEAFRHAERLLLDSLQKVARGASSTASERLFAAEASDALGFVEALRQPYDAVLMNPPFGEPIPETKEYVKGAYPWIPWKDYNLLAAFVGRGVELCNEHGYVGAITSRAGLFQVTFEDWRKQVLLGHHFVALADFGFGVMQDALVEAAAYVVGAGKLGADDRATFVRLLKETARPAALANAIQQECRGVRSSLVYRVPISELEAIPGSPFAYWVTPSIRCLFHDLQSLEGHGAEIRQGLATADDFRFVRAFWEIDPRRIGRSRAETLQGQRWVPFAKGGEYSPFYSDIHLLVDWEKDGQRLREFSNSVIRNPQYYFRQGLTWPERTTSGSGPYVLPGGSIFSHVGHACFPLGSEFLVLFCLNSRLLRHVMDFLTSAAEETASGTAARRYSVGLAQRLPWIETRINPIVQTQIEQTTNQLVHQRGQLDEGDELTRRFICPDLLRFTGETLRERILATWDGRERQLAKALVLLFDAEKGTHFALSFDSEVEHYLNEEYGPHPASYPTTPLEQEEEFARLYQTSMDRVIDEVIETRGGSRTIATKSYFLDRRLEVLAHVFKRHPATLAEARRRLGLLPPEEPRQSAEELLSYLVGCALGRWDVRIGGDPALAPPRPDPFDPVPICSPGMLVGKDGMPVRAAPSSYPLELPPDRLLLDEPGHRWDVLAAVRKVAAVLFADPDTILEEIQGLLVRQQRRGASRDLRHYFRQNYFRDHLGRYSKSRRKAPIYWYLSVPSREWGLWLYAPFGSREMLYAVVREARRKETALSESVKQLRLEEGKAAGRARSEFSRRLEGEESLLGEVKAFRVEAERIAELVWEPDLDDGIVLCAAPLADLFPAWPDAAAERKHLRGGEYPWATAAKWRERL
jgi:hypothetical protein